MKLTRQQLKNLISEVLNVNESIADLGFVNQGLLKAGLSNIKPEHAQNIRDFINNELKITNSEFNKISGMKGELKPLYDAYVEDTNIEKFIKGLREKLSDFLG